MSADYVEIAFPIPLNRTFHYAVPDVLREQRCPALGARVRAPFGKSKVLTGYVVGETQETPAFATKAILECLDPDPYIDAPMMALARWMTDRYLCSLGEALAAMVPPGLAPPKRQRGGEEARKQGSAAGTSSLTLTAEQATAIAQFHAAVDGGQFTPFLLRGITDSGKTELYFRTIDRVLEKGRQALYLLPEIALTPPFIEQLKVRYSSDRVGVWHSGLTPNQRFATWQGARSGQLQVILGARSAVFAPMPKLGAIIMDEEHEPSYKQEDRPRYHTREVALKRAELSKAVLIMGSATPSLESYWRAKEGEFRLVELTSRVEQRQLPQVELIDRRPPTKSPAGGQGDGETGGHGERQGVSPSPPVAPSPRRPVSSKFSVFSEPLKVAIEQRLARREQMMLFVNRRGYTPFLRCGTCGWVARCPRCSTTMAYHVKEEVMKGRKPPARGMPVPIDSQLICHACHHAEKPPIQCPSCKGMRLRQFGIGTQRVEEELKRLFPFIKVARMDQDVAGSRAAFERIYREFAGGSLDALVGTQMIAKGFDFPRVTLVGVVDADVTMHLPDFRAAERTFQLVAQVSGRTGRGETKGKALVQTHFPEHYALQAAKEHDYLEFFEKEIGFRQDLKYPPFCRLVNLVIRGPKEPVVAAAAETLAEKLGTVSPGVELLGPAPAPYARLRGQYRYQLLLKGSDGTLAPVLRFLHSYKLPKTYLSVDVDPMDLL